MNIQDQLRNIPSVDKVLLAPQIAVMLETYPRSMVVESIRETLSRVREDIRAGRREAGASEDAIAAAVRDDLERKSAPSLCRAVNATGVILHTGLGRAVLPETARRAVADVASGHSTLEIDRESGKRGSRIAHVEDLLTSLTGAEAATVVNNNAAAVFLAINALAAGGGEVIISRGQLVEIGGSFRIPDIIARAGCRIVEVGTTNRTRISDYEKAITEETALILRVHPSNFRIVGFTEDATLEELVELGRSRGVPVMDDVGSGALVDLADYGLIDEPMVSRSVKAGADIVAFSGDKLLGGPQAGILVGKRDPIESCRRNPIARVVRQDKLSMAALESTLKLYADPQVALEAVPTLRAISRPLSDIRAQAKRLASKINRAVGRQVTAGVGESTSQVGGGSVPGQDLPSAVVTLRSSAFSADDLSRHFRLNAVPIFGRIESDVLMLDVRTVSPGEEAIIVECLKKLIGR